MSKLTALSETIAESTQYINECNRILSKLRASPDDTNVAEEHYRHLHAIWTEKKESALRAWDTEFQMLVIDARLELDAAIKEAH